MKIFKHIFKNPVPICGRNEEVVHVRFSEKKCFSKKCIVLKGLKVKIHVLREVLRKPNKL